MADQPLTVGYAFFFERVVVFSPIEGSVSTLLSWTSSKGRRRFSGEYLGTVKGIVPVDPYRITYHVHHSTEAFKKRQKDKAWFKRRHISLRLPLDQQKL